MSNESSARLILPLAIVWGCLCGAAFVTLRSIDTTRDVAAFVIALIILQLPPFLALARARDREPLSAGRAVAIAIPAGFVGAFAAYFVFGSIAVRIFDSYGDLTGVAIAFAAALVGCIGSGLFVGLYLPSRPHPLAARRVLTWFAAASLVGGAVVVAVAERRGVMLGVAMAMPLAWSIPLLLLTRRKALDPVPVARVR